MKIPFVVDIPPISSDGAITMGLHHRSSWKVSVSLSFLLRLSVLYAHLFLFSYVLPFFLSPVFSHSLTFALSLSLVSPSVTLHVSSGALHPCPFFISLSLSFQVRSS